MKSDTLLYHLKKCAVAVLVLLIFMSCTGLASAAYDYLPVVGSDTEDYYRGYGEPELHGYLSGDCEFSKGENATLRIALANNGTLEKLVVRKGVGDISDKLNYKTALVDGSADKAVVVTAEELLEYQAEMNDLNALVNLSMKEMSYEADRVNALSVYSELVSPTTLIDIPSDAEMCYVSSVPAGSLSVISFPVNIDKKIPAGNYTLDLVVDYQFINNVLMYKAGNKTELTTTFLTDDDHTVEYADRSVVIPIEIRIKESPVFEVTNVDGNLVSGKTSRIDVTYSNTGDAVAHDAEAKISLMNPLSSDSSKAYLGDVAPGGSVTVSYNITADKSSSIEKTYGISSDIRYYDDDGDLKMSSSMRINPEMTLGKDYFTPKNVVLVLAAFCILYIAVVGIKKAAGRKKGRSGGKKEQRSFS